MTTRLLAAIRYNPKKYLQSIRCPIFIAYAKNDNLIDYLEHQKGIECALLEISILTSSPLRLTTLITH